MTLLSAPNITGNEWLYIKDCLDTAWVSSVGSYVDRMEKMCAEFCGTKYAVATSCGTTALHISLLLAGVKRRDYVIVPNITFIASCNAIKYTGADPILIDVDPETWQMDLDVLENFLVTQTELVGNTLQLKKNKRKIRVLMPVHVLGNMCNMERLTAICEKYKLAMVEDSTEALGSYYNGKHAGSFGLFGTLSFNGNKIITTGGGGMILTDDEKLAKKAKHLTTQAKSDSFEYVHDEIGYNYRLTNLAAAMGVAQMELLPAFIKRKHEIDAFYKQALTGIGDISFQKVVPEVNANLWLFTFKTKKQKQVLQILNDNKLQSRPFWVPMNQLQMFKNDLYISNNDQSNLTYNLCLSIPCSTYITEQELNEVVKVIRSCY